MSHLEAECEGLLVLSPEGKTGIIMGGNAELAESNSMQLKDTPTPSSLPLPAAHLKRYSQQHIKKDYYHQLVNQLN